MCKIDTLEVIFKVAEVCNLNCDYCYYFNGINDDHFDKPRVVKKNTIVAVVMFLKKSILKNKISTLHIGFHGGEPLLLGKLKFDEALDLINNELACLCDLCLNIQTNGVLIDDEWVKIFSRHKVSVNVSLDGNQQTNDLHRIYRSGKGTYADIVNGITLLNNAQKEHKIQPGGLLSVINPSVSGKDTYRHFVDDLGVRNLYFIPPDFNVNNIEKSIVAGVRSFYSEVTREWVKDNNNRIRSDGVIKIFSRIINKIVNEDDGRKGSNYVITIRSDGSLQADDEMRNIFQYFNFGEYDVHRSTLDDFLNDSGVVEIINGKNELAEECGDCAIRKICRSGDLLGSCLNRFSVENNFNNKSVYCSVSEDIIMTMFGYLIDRGVSIDNIERNLHLL